MRILVSKIIQSHSFTRECPSHHGFKGVKNILKPFLTPVLIILRMKSNINSKYWIFNQLHGLKKVNLPLKLCFDMAIYLLIFSSRSFKMISGITIKILEFMTWIVHYSGTVEFSTNYCILLIIRWKLQVNVFFYRLLSLLHTTQYYGVEIRRCIEKRQVIHK